MYNFVSPVPDFSPARIISNPSTIRLLRVFTAYPLLRNSATFDTAVWSFAPFPAGSHAIFLTFPHAPPHIPTPQNPPPPPHPRHPQTQKCIRKPKINPQRHRRQCAVASRQ